MKLQRKNLMLKKAAIWCWRDWP